MQAFISELSLDRATMEDKSFEEGKIIMLLHTMHSALFNMHAAGADDDAADEDDAKNDENGNNIHLSAEVLTTTTAR